MRSQRISLLVEIALSVALAVVLNTLAVRLPINVAGGSISFVMLPIFVVALRRGVVAGVVAGAIFGVTDFIREPFIVAPIQVVLDYGVAYAAVGLAGLGAPYYRAELARSKAKAAGIAVGFILLGGLGRFAAAWLSGVVFFGSYAPKGQPVWLYSAIYNASYIVPSLVMCAAAAVVILPILERAVPVAPRPARSAS